MKRFLSMALCVLMLVTMFTATTGQVFAAGNATEFFTVTGGDFSDDKITYTISLKPSITKLTGAIIEMHFDGADLRVVEDETNGILGSGIFVKGDKYGESGVYSIGYMDTTGVSIVDSEKAFIEVTFEAISTERTMETVEFECVEFMTDDGDDTNDINRTDSVQNFASFTFHTLSMPKVTEVNSYGDGLKVVWSNSQGAENYTLYRKVSGASEWTLLSDNLTGNEYLDTSITKGEVYSYTVSASNSNGETAYDNVGLAGMNFGNIASINAFATETGAHIEWSALNGAQKYEVYRKLATSENWQLINTVTACEYDDNSIVSAQVYNYKVKAIKDIYSADMSCEPATVKYIATPYAVISNTADGIEIYFEVVGAEKYIIEKKVSNGEYSVLTEIATTEDYSFIDEDVAEGIKYSYTIQAVDGEVSSVKKDIGSVIRLGKPAGVEVENTADGVSLKWNAVANATKYVISRKTGNETIYTDYTTTSTNYLDENVVSGVEYTYIISALNDSGCGASSEPPVSITFVNVPVIKSVAAIKNAIEVKWAAVSGAESYNVYRTTVNSTNWEVIGTTSELSFADQECKEGVYYKYTVSAVAGGSESAYNTKGVEGMYFGNVTWIKATPVTNGAEITWEALAAADSYEVYRKSADEANWVKLAKVTTTKYTDTKMASGIVYFYMVKAYNGKNVSDMIGEPANAKIIATPKGIAKNVSDGIQITVTPVNGAEGYVIEKKINGKFQVIATLGANETAYTDEDVVAENEYTYRVYAISTEINSGICEIGTILRVSCPKITSIKNDLVGICLEWTPIDDAVSYQVLRKEEGDNKWKVYANGITENTYEDWDVFNDTEYSYTINAIMPGDGETGYDAQGKSYVFVDTPDVISVANVVGGVQYKWYEVENADSYVVYRKTSDTDWVELQEVEGTSIVDKTAVSGVEYTYTVRAKIGDYESYFDDGLTIVCLATPTAKIAQTASGVKVTWNKVPGATHYRIYRKVGSGAWTKVVDVNGSYTSYTDTKSDSYSGKKCAYAVKAYHSPTKGWGSYKGTAGLVVLATPTATVSNADKGITIKWNKVPGATHYRIYRKTKTGTWQKVKDLSASYTSYTDTSVAKKSGTLYYYTVRPYHSSTKTWGSYKSSGAIMRLLTPTLKSATSSKSGITLKWNKIGGASGYIVYRKTTGGWSKLATVKGNSKISYLDKSAKKGVTYKYTVKAYYGTSTSYYNTKGIACKDRY